MSITEFVESPWFKKAMGRIYGIGASVVILGALFKILHLEGANTMLMVGLGTEAFIFFLSAFEKPHESPDWSIVYPELAGLESRDVNNGGGGGSELSALIQSGHLDSYDVERLSDGIKRLSTTSSQLSDLSNASLATESYLQNMKQAGESVNKLASVQTKSAQTLDRSVEQLSVSYESTARRLSESGEKLVNNIVKSSEDFAAGFSSNNLNTLIDSLTDSNKAYNDKLKDVTKNLTAINSAYELQIKGLSSQTEASQALANGISDIKNQFEQSAEDVKVYRQQVAQLSKSVSELNSVYGNMLSAMNMGNK